MNLSTHKNFKNQIKKLFDTATDFFVVVIKLTQSKYQINALKIRIIFTLGKWKKKKEEKRSNNLNKNKNQQIKNLFIYLKSNHKIRRRQRDDELKDIYVSNFNKIYILLSLEKRGRRKKWTDKRHVSHIIDWIYKHINFSIFFFNSRCFLYDISFENV